MKTETTHTPEPKPKRRPDWLTVLAAGCGGTMFGMLVMFTTVLPADAEPQPAIAEVVVEIGEPANITNPDTPVEVKGFTTVADSIGEALAKGMNKTLGGQEGEPYVAEQVTP